jgi:hypothetical protein
VLRAQIPWRPFLLQYLPQQTYSDNEVAEKSDLVYQHIYTVYPGGNGFPVLCGCLVKVAKTPYFTGF